MPRSFSQHRATTSDGLILHYKIAGDGPQNVIFMGGWGCTRDYYDETLSYMSLDGIRVLVFDLRGHGESDESSDNYSSRRQAQDLLELADDASMKTFVACGQSMGAKYVQYLPILAPDRVTGRILINGCPAGRIDVPQSQVDETAAYAGRIDAMRATHHAMTTQPVKPSLSEMWCRNAAKISHTVLKRTLEHCFYDDFEAEVLAAPPIPTLVVGSLRDQFFPVEMMQARVTALIAGAREIYLDCGHEIPLERPRELAFAIEAFLAGSSPR